MHGGFRTGLSIVLTVAVLLLPFSGASAHACAMMHDTTLAAEYTHHVAASAEVAAVQGSDHACPEAMCECCQDCAGSGCSPGGHGAVIAGATLQGRDAAPVWRATQAVWAADLTFSPLTPPPRNLHV